MKRNSSITTSRRHDGNTKNIRLVFDYARHTVDVINKRLNQDKLDVAKEATDWLDKWLDRFHDKPMNLVTDYTMTWQCQCNTIIVATVILGGNHYQCMKCGKWFHFHVNTGG